MRAPLLGDAYSMRHPSTLLEVSSVCRALKQNTIRRSCKVFKRTTSISVLLCQVFTMSSPKAPPAAWARPRPQRIQFEEKTRMHFAPFAILARTCINYLRKCLVCCLSQIGCMPLCSGALCSGPFAQGPFARGMHPFFQLLFMTSCFSYVLYKTTHQYTGSGKLAKASKHATSSSLPSSDGNAFSLGGLSVYAFLYR